MKKIMSFVLLATFATSGNAMSTVKSVANATVNTVKEHKVLTAAALTSTAAIAAGLFDYYKNDAKVMKTTVRIAKEYANIVFDKTKSATEKVAYLVKRNPVLAISAMLGAAAITDAVFRGKKSVPYTAGAYVADKTVAAYDATGQAVKTAKDFTVEKTVQAKDFTVEKAGNAKNAVKGLFKKNTGKANSDK